MFVQNAFFLLIFLPGSIFWNSQSIASTALNFDWQRRCHPVIMTKTAKRDMVSIPKLINSPLEIEQPLTGVGTVFSFVNKGTHSFGFISVSPKPSTIPKVNNTPLGEDSRIYFRASEYKDKKIANLAEIVGYEVDFLYSSDKQGRVCAVNIQLTKSMKMVLGASNSQEAVLSSSTPPSLRLVNVTISVESNNRQNTFTQNNIATTGTRANVAWRSVPISDLRKHPLYIPLEEPENVQVKSCRDFSRFRQDSWQWYDLHRGRLTTSKASTCLGFYEERGAEILSVPSSRIGHGSVVQAWQEMLESPLTDWTALQNQPHSFKSNHANKGLTKSNDSKKSKCPWVFYDNGLHESNACYVYMPDSNGVVDGEASDSCGQRAVTATDSMSARLSWGSYQVYAFISRITIISKNQNYIKILLHKYLRFFYEFFYYEGSDGRVGSDQLLCSAGHRLTCS